MTPTYDAEAGFRREYRRLSPEARASFAQARRKLVAALQNNEDPSTVPAALRIKRVRKTTDVWELSYSADGRATFQIGAQQKPGKVHVIWRRIGGHEILDRP